MGYPVAHRSSLAAIHLRANSTIISKCKKYANFCFVEYDFHGLLDKYRFFLSQISFMIDNFISSQTLQSSMK